MKPSSSDAADGLPGFVDLEAAARMAGVTRRTVQNKLAAGEIPAKAVRMNGRQKLVAVAVLESVFGPLKPSPVHGETGDEIHGTLHGNFHESPSDLAELRAGMAAKEAIIASLQATLDHERQDRAHERENWCKTLERTQANLLAAQDTPTARAIAGVSRPTVNANPESAATSKTAAPQKPRARPNRKTTTLPWWRSLFAG